MKLLIRHTHHTLLLVYRFGIDEGKGTALSPPKLVDVQIQAASHCTRRSHICVLLLFSFQYHLLATLAAPDFSALSSLLAWHPAGTSVTRNRMLTKLLMRHLFSYLNEMKVWIQ